MNPGEGNAGTRRFASPQHFRPLAVACSRPPALSRLQAIAQRCCGACGLARRAGGSGSNVQESRARATAPSLSRSVAQAQEPARRYAHRTPERRRAKRTANSP